VAITIKPSDFYTYYRPSECELRLYLTHKGIDTAPPSAFEQVIFKLGLRHEKNHLSTFPRFSDLTGKPAANTLEEIKKGSPVIYQGVLRAEVSIDGQMIEVVGIPDFMGKEN
jgi:hypothetical protein